MFLYCKKFTGKHALRAPLVERGTCNAKVRRSNRRGGNLLEEL